MKKIQILCFVLIALNTVVQSQNPGCDGVRYRTNIFTGVKKTTVTYASGPNYAEMPPAFPQTVSLSMDIYEPEGDTLAVRPVVVLAHGGSFMFGDRTLMKADCERLARQGYIAASIEYRLYPVLILGFPDSTKIIEAVVKAMGDMKAAVRYFRQDYNTANQFRVDTAHIYIGGYSAGSVAALHTAYLDEANTIPAFIEQVVAANGGINGNCGSADNQTYSARVGAVVNRSGGLYRSNWVDTGEVPLSSIHGTADNVVYYESGLAAGLAYLEGSSKIHARALEVNVSSTLVTAIGGDHTTMYESAQYAPQVEEFWTNSVNLLEMLTCGTSDITPLTAPEIVWNIFPNPAGQQFVVQLPAEINNARIQVVDALGRLLLTQSLAGQNNTVVIPDSWSKGLFEVLLSDANGTFLGTRTLVH